MYFRVNLRRLSLLILPVIFSSYRVAYSQTYPYKDSTKSADVRTEDLLSRMNIDEKVGQMAQAERGAMSTISDIKTYFIGSLLSGGGSAPASNTGTGWADMSDNFQKEAMGTRLGIPLIYGIDAVHGHNNVKDAVIFPHNIGLGAARNAALVKQAAQITAQEVIATGLHWTFAPCVAVPQNERWGRTYEGFGELPELAVQMGGAAIEGFHGDSLNGRKSILACAKHYLADGGTVNGTNEGNAIMDEQTLRKIHMPAYIEAIKKNVGSIMPSYSSWNGQKMHGNKYLLTDVLKKELGFKGFVISDYAAIDQLPLSDYASKVEASVNAGVDMIMLPNNYKEFTSTLKSLVSQGRVSTARIDDAVRRILKVKFQMGLFDRPYADRSQIAQIGSDAHRTAARECVRQSLVLLKRKDDVLPLKKANMKIHVAGKSADNIGNQCGGWTITWQGSSGNITKGTTILQAIKNTVITSTVTSSLDGSGAAGADIAVAVIGETPYAEGAGDRTDLGLSPEDVAVVRNLKSNNIPVVVVLLSGRPMILNQIQHYADAIIAAWLPGTEGQGVADVLFGDYLPTGKLPHSWPREMAQIPINFGDAGYSPLYEYGFGLTSYTNPSAGTAPQVLSALASAEGNKVEITFSKQMTDPSADYARFKVTSNSIVGPFVTKAELSGKDKTTIILTLEYPLQKGDKIAVSYTEGNIMSADGGKLKTFAGLSAYNLMNEYSAFTLPGKIEAENYSSMSGVQTEATTDAGGGLNVGYIDTGDWMEYFVNVPSTGKYNFNFRVAAQTASGQLLVKMSDTTVATVTLPVTGGWQTWRTQSATANLTKGMKYLRLHAATGGFNLNWFEVTSVTKVEDNSTQPGAFSLSQNYPNPFNPVTTIVYSIPERSNVKLAVYDLLGRELAVLVNEGQSTGSYSVTFDAASYGLSSGIYFYKLTAGDNTVTKKLTLMK